MRHESFDHGPLLEAWLKEPTWLPETDLARALGAVHRTPQRRGWSNRLPKLRFPSMLNATQAALAVAILVLSGTLLAGGLLPTPADRAALPNGADATVAITAAAATGSSAPSDPSPTDLAPPSNPVRIELPGSLPEGVESGTIDTPAGPARWVRLRGPAEDLPGPGQVIPWGDGIAVLAYERPSLYTTSNGVEWNEEPLPDDDRARGYVTVSSVAGQAILMSHPATQIWTSDGDGAWTELDTSALREVRLAGWRMGDPRSEAVGLADDDVVLSFEIPYRLPYSLLGLSRDRTTRWLHHVGGDRYALCRNERFCSAGVTTHVLRLKEADDGVVVRDHPTGQRLGLLRGATAGDIYEGFGGTARASFVIEGDRLVATDARVSSRGAPSPEPPAGLPADARAHYVESWSSPGSGSTWLAGLEQGGLQWAYLGGMWVDLMETDLPAFDPYAWVPAGLGNVTLLWSESHDAPDEQAMTDLIVFVEPTAGDR